MATNPTIKPRRGTSAPGVGAIAQNELAVDTTNKRIYIGAADGSGTLIGSAPGGSSTQIQFNDGGNLSGNSNLTFSKTSFDLTIGGNLIASGATFTNDISVNGGDINSTGALTITAGGTNTNINLVPNGSGTVDVASKRITNVFTPLNDTDAANKQYVDEVAQGLHIHATAKSATTAKLSTLAGAAVTYTS